ncbi:hypothetical protein ACE939_00735 [Aquimarina sp. W85]|uniref:hypothetical protein n=1 Tax=Aquimarina rhodophyticola TaxID=3342246 RepID=UPI00366C9774
MKKIKVFIEDIKFGIEQVKSRRRERRIIEAKLRAASIAMQELSKAFDAAISHTIHRQSSVYGCAEQIFGKVGDVVVFDELTEKEALQRTLKKAEHDEDYIKAAALRDQLKSLHNNK